MRPPRNYSFCLGVLGLGSLTFSAGLMALAGQLLGWGSWTAVQALAGAAWYNAMILLDKPLPYQAWAWGWANACAQAGAWPWAGWLGLGLVALGLVLSLALAWWISRPGPEEIHISGRSYLRDITNSLKSARKEMAAECSNAGVGIHIHPYLNISLDRESRHGFVLGGTGSGKTVVERHMIDNIIECNDKILIYDNKGDFTQSYEGALLAPWEGSESAVAWDISADIKDSNDAATFAEHIIPDSKEPMWSQSARLILVAIVNRCIAEIPNWTLLDIVNFASSTFDEIKNTVEKYNPIASSIVSEQSKTTQSILTNMVTFLAELCCLADFWDKKSKLSIKRWIIDDKYGPRVIIMQGNQRYSALSRAYIQSIINTIGSVINSPELPDSKNRRIWMVLDEFPQLGKLNNFGQFLEIGRSKGLRCILGMQDVAQLRNIYGKDTVDAWSSMIGTYIICRTQGKETPKWLSSLLGDRIIERYSRSVTASVYDSGGKQSPTKSESYIQETVPVVRPDQLGSDLGLAKDGIVALLHTGGNYIYRLHWPFTEVHNYRPAVIPRQQTCDSAARLAAAGRAAAQQAVQAQAAAKQAAQAQPQADEPSSRPGRKVILDDSVILDAEEPAEAQADESKRGDIIDELVEKKVEEVLQQAADHLLPGAGPALHGLELLVQAAEALSPANSACSVIPKPGLEEGHDHDDEEPEQEDDRND